ncbi:probable ATP-dependent DNA helicase HFM1 [Ornithorhynchus anatinus]|uniref:Probable ATP-dependent DNA helicase HFM1 n=1 Tax=Ornithorhynchus anatinus TaxID=9258 RepID=F7EBB6_ORNAN|nr:probable ATP-dependent DNA helicase HFM1 [Ornithorhynchus anatinus]
MLNSKECMFSFNSLFFDGPDESETYLNSEKTSWYLPPPPLISEIPDTQTLKEELRALNPSDQEENQRRFFITNENTDCISPTQESQLYISPNKYEEIEQNLGERHKGDLPLTSSKLTYNYVQDKYENQKSTLSQLERNYPNTTLMDFPGEDKNRSATFPKRLFEASNYTSENVEYESPTMNFHISSMKDSETEVKEELWRGSNTKKALQYSYLNPLRAKHILPDSETGDDIFKTQSFKEASKSFCPLGAVGKDLCRLRSVSEIPAQFRNIFKEFPYFNYIQSKALDDIFYSDRNFVISAPTGSGKTVIFELAITRLLMELPMPWLNIKIVYMAPIKALCSQRFDDWKEKFGPIGLNCKEITGDTAMDDLFEIQHAHIIMTTPEKWDSMTRKWRDNSMIQLVRLFLIDEVHVIKEENRGPTLEVVVSRMKTIQSVSRLSENTDTVLPVRFVAVSATIPNSEDIAEWLSDGKRPAVCLKMDESCRPVKLRKVVLGFPCSNHKTEFKFDLMLNYKIANVIQTYSDQKPALVFCATRKGVQQAASVLAKDVKFIMSVEQKQRLQICANSTKDSKLRDLLMCGVGYHHAGMELSDRKLIEGAFTVGDLPVLFTTSTLAMGVNLPAHLVVIKSTMHYVGGMVEEYSETDILQMIGRAGRPQFDTTATAVIMTRMHTREQYMQLLTGADTIESSLHRHLIEHLNAEIVLRTITDVNIALEWIRSTFLYIRALKNPAHYGFSSSLDKVGIEAKLQELCLKDLNALSSANLIKMDEDVNFKPTEAGRLMAWYYIAFETVKKFGTMNGTETLSDLVTMISSCNEFLDVQLRINEKKTLNTLNKDKNRITIRFPMEGKIKTRQMKVNCLIQAQLGCIPIQDFTLTQDTAKIFRNGTRITKWLSDFLATEDTKFSALLNSLILAKCFRSKLWENSLHVSKQLEKIGVTLSNAMVNAGLTSFRKIEDINARELELILNRHPPFGNQIKDTAMHLPKYELEVEQITKYGETVAEILVTVILSNFKQLQTKRTAPDSHYVTLLIGNADNQVVFKQKIMDSALLKTGNWTRKLEAKRALKSEDLSINLISSEYVGLDIRQKFTAFYLGPKVFGSRTVMPRKSETEPSQSRHSVVSAPPRVDAGGTCNKSISCKKSGTRECNHPCKNKDTCGHDCCKIGVSKKAEARGDFKFSSYLIDLRNRNSGSSVPPAKRLKMQMTESQNMNLKQFGFCPKSSLPRLSRTEWAQIPEAPSAEQWDRPEFCGKSQSQPYLPSEYDKSSLPPENYEMRRYSATSREENSQATISKRNLNESVMHNLTGSDKCNPQLAVTFELGDEVWDDFDDEKLLRACNFLDDTESTETSGSGNTFFQSGKGYKMPLQKTQSTVQGEVSNWEVSNSVCTARERSDALWQTSVFSLFNPTSKEDPSRLPGITSTPYFQERKLSPIPEVETVKIIPPWEKSSNSFHFDREGDSFVCGGEGGKETDLSVYHPDDETNAETSAGIFDGIF